MDKNNLIELTKELYRLTLLFPKKEPLRYKMRELADEILANSTQIKNLQIKNIKNHSEKIEARPLSVLEELEVLDSFFEVAKAQNWVSPGVLLAIQREYSKIKEDLCQINREEKEMIDIEIEEKAAESEIVPQYPFFQDKEKINPVRDKPALFEKGRNAVAFLAGRISNGVNERQRRILEILKEKERAQVWELKAVFPQVTKRTLRRDFEQMFKKGLIERIGEKNDTYYQLKPFLSNDK